MHNDKIKIVISNNKHSIEKHLNIEGEKKYFINQNLGNRPFDWWVRPIQFLWPALREFKDNHFIVRYLGLMFKNKEFPSWLYNSKEFDVKIEVIHE